MIIKGPFLNIDIRKPKKVEVSEPSNDTLILESVDEYNKAKFANWRSRRSLFQYRLLPLLPL